jgi:hypothetical protein
LLSRESILEYYEHMADRSVQMHAIAGASGAGITGVALAEDLEDAAIAAIRRAWLDSLAQHHPINGYDPWRGAMHGVTLAGGQPR